jgi:hypothetical protein
MRNVLIPLTGLLAISFFLHAQDTTAFKRPAYKLKVAVDKESFYEQEIKSGPYVLPDNSIQLYPGETVYVEINQENGVIKKMHAFQIIRDSGKTVTISFSQDTKGRVHSLMMLKVINPFDFQLIYKARVFLLSQKRWVSTDVYPVEPGLSSYETWPDIITSIGLGDWTLQRK